MKPIDFDRTCRTVFEQARATHTFPGGSVHCARPDWTHQAAYQFLTYDQSEAVTTNTLYDIASLTKLFTATAFLRIASEQNVALETPLAQFMAEFAAPPLREITLLHLLQHTSGLALHVQELAEVPRAEWRQRMAAAGLISEPGATVRYTCTAFVLLGWVTEILAGANLESVMTARVIEPLGLERTCYHAARRFALSEIAPTEVDAKTGVAWRGVVHDEAARALGGIAGNSGLFSTAADLGTFAQMWLREGAHQTTQILPAAVARRALTEAVAAESYQQALAWHCDVNSWMSLHAPHGTAGHLGFTGPMLWISPAQQSSLVVLNNRVYPTRDGPRRMNFLRTLSEAALGKAAFDAV